MQKKEGWKRINGRIKYRGLAVLLAMLGLFGALAAQRRADRSGGRQAIALGETIAYTGKCVVIDAGHGGADPGKVGVNGAREQDINLRIALLLRQYLEAEDIRVILTRENEEGLYDAGASNKKVQDMKRRIALIDEVRPDITVSIHQNSYPSESVHGAQVFYYTGSAEGQALAEKVQRSLIRRVDPENKRHIKANDSYYLLKKTSVPIVIVECGFLSNGREAELLCAESYQKNLAWAIHLGILQYLNEKD